MTEPKSTPKTCKISIRITPGLRKRLEALAAKTGTRLSAVAIRALDVGLDALEWTA